MRNRIWQGGSFELNKRESRVGEVRITINVVSFLPLCTVSVGFSLPFHVAGVKQVAVKVPSVNQTEC